MVILRQKWYYSGKVVIFVQKWMYWGKYGGQKGRIRKSVCIGAKWLHSSKIGCIQAKVFVFGQSG